MKLKNIFKNKKINHKSIFFILVICLFAFEFVRLEKKINSFKDSVHSKFKRYRYGIVKNVSNSTPKVKFPKKLDDIPFDSSIVLSTKKVQIRNILAPYNASLVEKDDGYLLFFRYDIVRQMHLHLFHSYIGLAELDKDFNQSNKEFLKVNTKSDFSEDPRILKKGKEYYLVYNDLISQSSPHRSMHLAHIDIQEGNVSFIQELNRNLQPIAKNWNPFVYPSDDPRSSIYFEYQIFSPRKILKLEELNAPRLTTISSNLQELNSLWWDKKWGKPRGGTPARLVDGEYLAFFHSNFTDENGLLWFVMGAYTFEASPPFQITGISPNPILFKGIYDSESIHTAPVNKKIIYPCGYALEDRNGKVLIHLACGENDSAIKILTIDKDALLNSLKRD